MKHSKRFIAILLTVLLVIGIMPMSAFAASENTPKEEVVYINLNTDGSVKQINVVNIFDLEKDGQIVDYGQYESVQNMTTTDKLEVANNTIIVNAKAGKLYYEGTMKNNAMPWTISIHYFMDGKEYSAKEIAGRNGDMEIKMTIRQNKACDSSFFEGFALQATFTLDTDKASNIKADGATMANVGSNKQITYTILPNTEKDINISAKVSDFEMPPIAINGIRMNMDVDFDDSGLKKKIDEIINAVNELDDGAGKLNDGAGELYRGTEEFTSAAKELHSGVGALNSGASDLKTGLDTLASKNKDLTGAAMAAYEALCSAAEIQLNAQLTGNGLQAVKLTPTTYADVLLGVLKQMNADTVYNQAYHVALAEVRKQVNAQADNLYTGYIQLQADKIYLTYIQSQSDVLYRQVATQAVIEQLIANGYSEENAVAYINTEEGNLLVEQALAAMTENQKEQIISAVVQSLTTEQKQQILQGAVNALTDEQKREIRNGYIQQMMASGEVTSQINKAVKAASTAAAQVSELKGQLDNYGAFYHGLVEYTNGVSSAANGAAQLRDGLSTLYSNTDTLKSAVGELHIAVSTLKDGTSELRDGTQKFVDETADMDTQISGEINSLKDDMTGSDIEIVSFTSKNNTNIKSVQFVIQTESISVSESVTSVEVEVEHLNFWQKLLRLFGLY